MVNRSLEFTQKLLRAAVATEDEMLSDVLRTKFFTELATHASSEGIPVREYLWKFLDEVKESKSWLR